MLLLLFACLQDDPAPTPAQPVQPAPAEPSVAPVEPAPATPVDLPEAAEAPDPFAGLELGVAPSVVESLPPDSHGEPVLYAPDGGEPSGLSVALSRTTELSGVPCSGQLMVDGSGHALCRLGRDHRFGEHLVRRGAQVGFWLGEQPSLRQFTFFDVEPPKQHLTLGAVPCENAATLHQDGSVARCMLGRDATLDGHALPHGVEVFLDESGGLTKLITYDTLQLGGAEYAPGTLIFEDGQVQRVEGGRF